MPGSHCSVVGCSTCSTRSRGLSFFRILRPNYPEWERALVDAVNRNRVGFKLEKAHICSRHFEDSCFEFFECCDGKGLPLAPGRRLIPGSIPTRWMPKRKFDREHSPRKAPCDRAAAEIPIVVKYYTFGEVQKAAYNGLPTPWILVKNTDEEIIAAVVDCDCDLVKLRVNVKPDFSTSVRALGFPVLGRYSTGNIESISLKKYLQSLSELKICPGIIDAVLQKYADLPISDTKQVYFKHIRYVTVNDIITHTSTVRSKLCVLLTGKVDGICKQCTRTQNLLQRKHIRAVASEMKPLDPRSPLKSLTPQRVIEELKSERRKSKRLEEQLDKFIHPLPNESPVIPKPLQEPVKRMTESNSGSSLSLASEQSLPKESPVTPKPFSEPVRKVMESNSESSLSVTSKQSLPNGSPMIPKPIPEPEAGRNKSNNGSYSLLSPASKQSLPNASPVVTKPTHQPVTGVIQPYSLLSGSSKQPFPNGTLMILKSEDESVIKSKTVGFRSLLHPNSPSHMKVLMVPKPQQSEKSANGSNKGTLLSSILEKSLLPNQSQK